MVTTDQGALNNLKQAILSAIKLHGIEAAKSQFLDKPLTPERQAVRDIFASLEQTNTGKWRFKPE